MTDIEPGAPTPITGGDDGGESEGKPDELDTGEQRLSGDAVIPAGREESAQVDQAMAAHDLGGNASAVARRARGRRWGAVLVVVAAGAGIIAGVVRRRNRRRRSRWPWKRR